MGGDPGMGGAPMGDPMGDPMGGDPGMGGGPMDGGAPVSDPGMGGDPGMNDGQLNPDMSGDSMGDDPMGGDPGMEGGEAGDDSTMSLFNQLSDEDKEAARGYIESMLTRDESNGGDMGGEEPPMGGPQDQGGAPMMESFVFSKKQLRSINEYLPVTDIKKRDEKVNDKKKGNNTPRKSPFNSPKFK